MEILQKAILLSMITLVISGAFAQVDDDRFIDSPVIETVEDVESDAYKTSLEIVEAIFSLDSSYLYKNSDILLHETIPDLMNFVSGLINRGGSFNRRGIFHSGLTGAPDFGGYNSCTRFRGSFSDVLKKKNAVSYYGEIGNLSSEDKPFKIVKIVLTDLLTEETFVMPLRISELQSMEFTYPDKVPEGEMFSFTSKLISEIEWLQAQEESLYQSDWEAGHLLHAGVVALANSDSNLFESVLALYEVNGYYSKRVGYLRMLDDWISGGDVISLNAKYISLSSAYLYPQQFHDMFSKHLIVFNQFGLKYPDPESLIRGE